VQTKASSADLVTETDKQVEELIFSFLREKFPSHW
jgi:fructose-1,6-bisphosphatase/inositol monophosphatase family enzyme